MCWAGLSRATHGKISLTQSSLKSRSSQTPIPDSLPTPTFIVVGSSKKYLEDKETGFKCVLVDWVPTEKDERWSFMKGMWNKLSFLFMYSALCYQRTLVRMLLWNRWLKAKAENRAIGKEEFVLVFGQVLCSDSQGLTHRGRSTRERACRVSLCISILRKHEKILKKACLNEHMQICSSASIRPERHTRSLRSFIPKPDKPRMVVRE